MQEPAITQKDPIAYYRWLRAQRMPGAQATQLVEQRFGPPTTPDERAQRQQAEAENANLAQAGGIVGGTIAAQYIPSLFASGAPAAATPFGSGLGSTVGGAISQAAGTSAATGGAASGAGAGASGAGAATTGSSVASVALPVAAVIAGLSETWESGMKDIVRGRGNKQDWANMGVNAVAGVGPNLVSRWLGKPSIGRRMTSGKSDAQLLRDDFRGSLKESGVADDKYMVTLADGSKFNIGLDGKTKYENTDGSKRNAWDVDFSNPLAKLATDKIDPMIRNIYGPDAEKAGIRPEQYTGMLVNAVTSNAQNEADVMANIETMLGKSTFAKQAGMGIQAPPKPVARPPRGEVVRVSPGMYMNDKGIVGPAKTVKEALRKNYEATKSKKEK
jgi:hypothetical protein